jgi:hypothetical protein
MKPLAMTGYERSFRLPIGTTGRLLFAVLLYLSNQAIDYIVVS